MPNVLAVVPARGGSKGILGKNIVPCAGRPLIDWTAQAIKDSELIDFSVLSTDSPEIAQAWTGGHFIVKHDYISDEAQIEDRLDNVFAAVEDHFTADYVVLLQPTSPIRPTYVIDKALEMMEGQGFDSLVSVVRSHRFIWQLADFGDVACNYVPTNRPRRQDIKDQFEENGSIYIFTMDSWRESHCRISGKVGILVMPEECVLQVDTPMDLYLAEQILEKQQDLALVGG